MKAREGFSITCSIPISHLSGVLSRIFAELFRGNFAKLQPQEGQDLMDGLEVKVRLGSTWKQRR